MRKVYWQLQEDGLSDEAAALAVARAHERLVQADLAQAQAAAEQSRDGEGSRGGARQRGAPAGSQTASRSQARQLQALSTAEQVGNQGWKVHST
jgi:hypothetical protein